MFSLSNWILSRISGCLICTFSACPFTKPDKVNIVFPNPLPLILCSKVLLFFLICAFHSLEIDFEISFQYFQHLFLPHRFHATVHYEGVAVQGEVKKAEAKVGGA